MTLLAPELRHRYYPRGAALALMNDRSNELVAAGPAGTGKSRACLEKLHLLAGLNPGLRALMVRKTLASLTASGLVTYREHVAAEAIAGGEVAWYGGSSQEAAQYRYANGSVVVVGGMDRATRVMSTEYDAIYVQEATELTETDWESLTTRLRNGRISFQQLLADCNPAEPTHWLKQRCERGATKLLESRHEDNPVLFNDDGTVTPAGEAYVGRLDALTGVRYYRLRKGLWVAAEGVIYEEWDPAIHLIDRFFIPKDWTRWWVVDFGFVHSFVLQCWAEDPDGRLYMYREIYRSRRLVEDHAADILTAVTKVTGKVPTRERTSAQDIHDDIARGLREWKEPRPRAIICDHDAEDRATLQRHLGMSTQAAKKDVRPGIQAVQARLRPQPDGKPRLFILRDSTIERDPELELAKKPCSTAEEIPGYVWLSPSGDRPAKEEPLKDGDDGSDCMRYMVAARDLGGRTNIRFM